jgi:choline dehydrogenase-like flavoprotein
MKRTVSDVLVIGSGFGGALAASHLLDAGYRVRMLERGNWLDRSRSSAPRGPADLDCFFDVPIPHRLGKGGNGPVPDDQANVGGPSVYFAAVSSRFRARDFEPAPEIVTDSGAAWPFGYDELRPFYDEAEQILGVAGPAWGGVTEPPHGSGYPQDLIPLSRISRRLQAAAERLGHRPFRLPLAINYRRHDDRRPCEACAFCDGFPCLVGAKNDIAHRVLPTLLRRGLLLEPGTTATRLVARRGRVTEVEARDTNTGEPSRHVADTVVLAAGAVATPTLVLASGLEASNPAGDLVGRFLMRHCNAHVFGLFWRRPDRERRFHKELGLDDFYFGHPSVTEPAGKLGMVQQMATPWVALVLLPRFVARAAAPLLEHLSGLLVMAEDQPQRGNRVLLDGVPGNGSPRARIVYQHSARDLAARQALIRKAKEVLREAGAPARIVFPLNTFSHAVGTMRMGTDPAGSVLDGTGRYRGMENLYVADGSVMPTSGGVNPSLTIAATALRTARHIAMAAGRATERKEASTPRPRLLPILTMGPDSGARGDP